MKVILQSQIKTLGQKGDIVDVSEGYFRNHLAPRRLAKLATDGALNLLKAQGLKKNEKIQNAEQSAKANREKIEGKTVTILAKSHDEDKLYAAVSTHQILEAIQKSFGLNLEVNQIGIPTPIKTLGTHHVEIKLLAGTNTTINVLVKGE